MDATTAINQAWRRSAGLLVRWAPGKVGSRRWATVGSFRPTRAERSTTPLYWRSRGDGRNSVEVRIVRGPTGDLGFPVATEADGGAPNSRVTVFSASDKPVIFWTPDNGAIIVRGAINAAWTKLGGAAGKLVYPPANVVSTATPSPRSSAVVRSPGIRTPTRSAPSPLTWLPRCPGSMSPKAPPGTAAAPHSDKGFTWHWWWLLVIIPVLMLIALVGLGLMRVQRRRAVAMGERDVFGDAGYVTTAPVGRVASWAHPGGEVGKAMPGPEDIFDGDQDSVDTTPTRFRVVAAVTGRRSPSMTNTMTRISTKVVTDPATTRASALAEPAAIRLVPVTTPMRCGR